MENYEGLIKLAKKSNKKNNAGLASMIGGGALLGGAAGGGIYGGKRLNNAAKRVESLLNSEGLRQAWSNAELGAEHYPGLAEAARGRARKAEEELASQNAISRFFRNITGSNKKLRYKANAYKRMSNRYEGLASRAQHDYDVLTQRGEGLVKTLEKLQKNKKLTIGAAAALGLLGTGLLAKGIYDRNKSKK